MLRLVHTLQTFVRDESGYDLVEFALAAALAGSVSVMALRSASPEFASALSSLVGTISSHLER